MPKKLIILVALASLALGGVAVASGNAEKKQDRVEVKKDQQHLKTTKKNLRRLAHTVDLWHDANLKGDQNAVSKWTRDMYQILQEDVNSTQAMVSACEREVGQSAREFQSGHRRWSEKIDDRQDLTDDQKDLLKAQQMLGAKKRLIKSWSNSEAFSNKYRLINDYLGLMRTQTGMKRMELAEDIGELHEGR